MSLKAATMPGSTNEPVLHCPACNHEIRLTASLAGPLIEQTRRRFQALLAEKDAEMSRKTDVLRAEREQLTRSREEL
ncbi:MAG: hypothetical protein QOG74_2989, partial [Alphaproteobacteria bacterium]|nr:hypothetical protein [Alphaproteobacteria bacterium]